ncbi:MAG: sensor histidine kinase [Bacillota bacterium]
MDVRADFRTVTPMPPLGRADSRSMLLQVGLDRRPSSAKKLVRAVSSLWAAMAAVSMSAIAVLGVAGFYGFTTDQFPLARSALIASLAGLVAVLFLAWRKTLQNVRRTLDILHRTAVLREQTEAELRTLEIEYRDVFKAHPTPLWIFDRESLHIIAVNDAAINHYGYSRREFLKMTIKDIRPETDVATLGGHFLERLPNLSHSGTWKHKKKNGSLIDVEIVAHELDWHGRRVRIVSATDVTKRMAAERELMALTASLENQVKERTEKARRYARNLRERKHELELANRDLEMFSYSASHDLKTPLAVMKIYAMLLQTDFGATLPPAARDHVEKILAATQGMSALVDDLMKLAKLSKHVVQKQTVNLSKLAATQIALLQAKDPARTVEVKIQGDITVHADPGLLGIALENLIGNAWKYSTHAAKPRIKLGVKSNGAEQILYVRDNGAGFDMHCAEGLFKPFRRLHSNEEFEGTGIGLAIVQRVVALHGGCTWAYGEVGQGATFYFTLAPASSNALAAPTSDDEAAAAVPGGRLGLALRPEAAYGSSGA